jgi:hypothetical protein
MKEVLCSDFRFGFSFSLFRHLSVIVLDDGNLSLVYRDMTAGIMFFASRGNACVCMALPQAIHRVRCLAAIQGAVAATS